MCVCVCALPNAHPHGTEISFLHTSVTTRWPRDLGLQHKPFWKKGKAVYYLFCWSSFIRNSQIWCSSLVEFTKCNCALQCYVSKNNNNIYWSSFFPHFNPIQLLIINTTILVDDITSLSVLICFCFEKRSKWRSTNGVPLYACRFPLALSPSLHTCYCHAALGGSAALHSPVDSRCQVWSPG